MDPEKERELKIRQREDIDRVERKQKRKAMGYVSAGSQGSWLLRLVEKEDDDDDP